MKVSQKSGGFCISKKRTKQQLLPGGLQNRMEMEGMFQIETKVAFQKSRFELPEISSDEWNSIFWKFWKRGDVNHAW